VQRFRGRIGLELLPVAACPKASQGSADVVETERGAWPVVELLVGLCLELLINI